MITVPVELDLVSAAIVEFAAQKNANAFLVSFLADEVKQTQLCNRPNFAQKVKHTRTRPSRPALEGRKSRGGKHEGLRRANDEGKAVAE